MKDTNRERAANTEPWDRTGPGASAASSGATPTTGVSAADIQRAEFGDDEFVGHTFRGSPERRHRLWFLDRHIGLFLYGGIFPKDFDVGWWTITTDPQTGSDVMALTGVVLRYDYTDGTSAVWRLTDTIIPHIHTFGFDDDVWRLGLWPD